jgi:hypothetical protein
MSRKEPDMRFSVAISDEHGYPHVPALLHHVVDELDDGHDVGILFDDEGNEVGDWRKED